MKESKGLGISCSCTKCRHTALKYANFNATGYFFIECPHCKLEGITTILKIELIQEMKVKVTEVTPSMLPSNIKVLALLLISIGMVFGLLGSGVLVAFISR